MYRGKIKTTSAFRFIAVLLVMVLTLEFVVTAPVQALNYSSRNPAYKNSEGNIVNYKGNYAQKPEEFVLAEADEIPDKEEAIDNVKEGSAETKEVLTKSEKSNSQGLHKGATLESQKEAALQQDVMAPANDIIVYLESGIMGAMSVEDDSSGKSPQGGIPENIILMPPQPGETVEQAVERLLNSPGVAYAEPNYLFYTQDDPEDVSWEYYPYTYDPLNKNHWALKEISIWEAWGNAREMLGFADPSPVTVAVIDTGVDWDHEDFWFEDPESEGTMLNRVLEGYNVINDTAGWDVADDDSYNGHGTHIAGIIAAATNNRKGIAGSTGEYPVSILPIKALGSSGTGTMLNIADAIRYAADNGAKVINLSLGARLPNYPKNLADAVKYAQDRGIVVVAAAGNDGGEVEGFYPACLPDVISVGATDISHKQLSFSNRGATICAPGKDILSTLPGDDYGNLTGTSQAAAFVSGTVALMLTSVSYLQYADIYSIIKNSASSYNSGVDWVLNSNYAIWNPYYGGLRDSVEIVSPANESFVAGVIDITAVVGNPAKVSGVEFGIQNIYTGESESVTIPKEDESGRYIYRWDTTQVEDGYYVIYADSIDNDNYFLESDYIYCTVVNSRQDGLVIKVIEPGIERKPAAGALVTVHHAYPRNNGYGEYMEFEELWYGHADMNGVVIIPGTVATSGNDYFVTAKGNEPSFVYYATVRAPSIVEIDSSNSCDTVIEAKDLNGAPLAGAHVLVELLESNIPGSTTPDRVIDFGNYSEYRDYNISTVATLDSDGKANIYLTKGRYNIRVIRNSTGLSGSSPYSYYLFNYGVDINTDNTTITFAPQQQNIAILNFQADRNAGDTTLSDASLTIECEEPEFDNFADLASGGTIVVTPGCYKMNGTLKYVYSSEYNDTEWTVNFDAGDTGILELNPGDQVTLQAGFGGGASLEITLSDPDANIYSGSFVSFNVILEDNHGNWVYGISKKPGNPYPLDFGWFTISKNGGVAAYRNIYSCTSEGWSIPGQFTGEYTAKIRINTPMFGEITDSVNFLVLPGSGDTEYYNGLPVKILDRLGNPMSGARIVPITYTDSPVSSSLVSKYSGFITDDYGMAGVYFDDYDIDELDELPDEVKLGLLVLGESVDPANPGDPGAPQKEPFFMFVPLNTSGLPPVIEINTSEYQMKRVVFESYDQEGNLLTEPHYNAIYADTGGGIYAGLVLEGSGERALWLPDGTYEYQAFINSAISMNEVKPLYFMTESFVINTNTSGAQTITLGGENLVAFNCFGTDILAMTLHKNGNGMSPVFYRNFRPTPDVTQIIFVTPGTYYAQGVVSTDYYSEIWYLWISNTFTLEKNENPDDVPVWNFDGYYSMQFDMDKLSPGISDTVTFSVAIKDGYENRVIGACANEDIGFGIGSLAEDDDEISAQHHYIIAPFIYIKNPQGEEIFRYKSDGSNYDLILEWLNWKPEEDGTLKPFSEESTFFGAKYTVPEGLHSGEYTAVAELDLTFLDTFIKEKTFYIEAGLTAPVLNQQEPLVTNAGSVPVSGTASPNAMVKFFYTLNGGGKTEAGTVQAGANGSFASNVTLPSEGTYIITAVVTENGLNSRESNQIVVTVDRTPPGQPLNLRGESPDQSHVNLSWAAPSGEEPGDLSYEIYRNEIKIAGNITGGESLYYQDSGLLADTEYTYRVVAVDLAGNRSNAAGIAVKTSKGPDTVPPAIPSGISAVFDGLSSVNISWNTSTDNVGVKGYKVYRRLDNTSEWVHIGTVDALSALSYSDRNLYAETKYWYSVSAYDEAGNESEKGEPVSVTTPSLNLDNAVLRIKKDRNGLAEVGAEMTIIVYGAKNRNAYAELNLEYWEADQDGNLPESPAERTETIQLEELKDIFGNGLGEYHGTYIIQENTAAIKSAKAFISDEAEPAPHLASFDMAGLPLVVSGRLTVTISQASQIALNAIRGGKLSIWSNKEKWGAYELVNDPITYSYSGVIPADDYKLELTAPNNRIAFVLEGIKVYGGRNTPVTLAPPEPASLYVRVTDEDGNPVGGVKIAVANSETKIASFYWTNEKGWATVSGGGDDKQSIYKDRFDLGLTDIVASITQDMERDFYPPEHIRSIDLSTGAHEIEITLYKRPKGTLAGVITGFGGTPLENASLSIIQEVAGRKITRSVKTDAGGNYSIELNTGPAEVSIRHSLATKNNSWLYNVVIEEGKTTTLSVDMKPEAVIKVNAYTKLAGQPEYPIVMSSWRVEAHIMITIRQIDSQGNRRYVTHNSVEGMNDTFIIPGAQPGDRYEVELNGRAAGFGIEKAIVEMDENLYATTEMHLMEKGLIKVDFRNQHGEKFSGGLRSIYLYDGNSADSRLVTSINSGDNDISLHLDEGVYTAIFCWGKGYQDKIVTGGYPPPSNDFLLTLGSMENHLASTTGGDYTKVENIQITFNEITNLGRITVPYGILTFSGAFDNDETWLSASKSEAGPGSVITLRAHYQLSEGFSSQDVIRPELRLDIPNETTLIEGSIVVETENGVIPNVSIQPSYFGSYISIDLKDENGYLCSNSGTVTYQVRVERRPEWPIAAASVTMYYVGRNSIGMLGDLTALIGEVYIEIPYVSISAPEIVTSPVINLKGYAPSDTDIRIYDGPCLLAETTVSRYGTWMQEIELVNRGDPSNHWLYARVIDKDGNELAVGQTMVTYDSKYPVINRITMGQTSNNSVGHVVSYNPLEGMATFPYVYVPNWETYFIIGFNNSSRVEADSVVVRCGNGKTLRAEYRQDTNDFYASGKISGNGKNYMPGSITIDYEALPEQWSPPSEIPTMDEVRSSLPGALMDADVSVDDTGVYEPDADSVYRSPTVTIRSSGTSGANFELEGWMTIKPLASYTPVPSSGAYATVSIGKSSSGGSLDVYNFHYSISQEGGVTVIRGGYIAPIEVFDNSIVSEMRMQNSIGALLEVGFTVIDKLNTFVTGATSIMEAPSMFDEIEGLLDYVDQNCNSNATDLYYQLLNMEAEGMMRDFAVTSAMSLAGAAISATGFGLAVGVSVFIAGNLFNWLVSAQRKDSVQELREMIMNDDRCRDEDDEDDDDDDDDDDNDNDNNGDNNNGDNNNNKRRKNSKRSSRVSDHEYILDPSGYVFEAVPENRIEGVKTTLYEYNSSQAIWEVWDSKYYGQDNPLMTDAQGRYAWDVPEGDWRVMYEKDGYETASSPQLHVPPPHTDVNIGLVSLVSPAVSSVTAAAGGEYIEIVFSKYMKTGTIGDRTLQVQKEGAVDDDDNPLLTIGDIVPVNPYTPDPGDPQNTLAQVFRFVPDAPLEVNGKYNIWVSSMVQSYAGSIMGADYTGSVTVPEKVIPVASVALNKSTLTLYPGESSRLSATVLPANATDKTVTWQSSKPNVADVDNTGLVTAYTTGTAVITVTTTDGGYTASCTVNVISKPVDSGGGYQYIPDIPVTGITLDKTELSLTVGDEPVTLNASVMPSNATNKNVIWSSSNQNVAVVQDGIVTPVGAGTAIITAKTAYGGYTASCTVTVKSSSDKEVFSGKAGVNPTVVEAFDGDISLAFETATFLSDIDVTIERFEPDIVPAGYVRGSSVFDISFGGQEPRKSVSLIARFDSRVSDEINPLKFALYRWDDDSSGWVYAGGAVSAEKGVVVAEIETPGRYMLMAYDRTFVDILTHWSREEVEILASRHVVDGYGKNDFRPENQITRAEFVKLVMSMVPYCPYVEAARSKKTGSYNDVSVDKWYFPYVEAATELGIVAGSGGYFRPESPVTREEMALILIRIFNTPAEMEQVAGEYQLLFKDSDEISEWALGAVVLAYQKGIIRGDDDGRFRPKDYAKRAEAAAVILRTMENLGFIKAPETLKGTLRVVDIEGTHFELECSCPSKKTYYVIIPADSIIEKQLKLFIDSEVQITGILQEGANIYMRGPVLKALSIGDKIRTACAKCEQQ